jgi:CheY-like chemotaxis protein
MATALVVDDDPGIRDIVQHVLAGIGFKVLQAGNGIQALGALEKGRVDLMVLDIFMPDLGGIGLLENLPPRHKQIPVIMMSGGADRGSSEPLERAKRLGARRILSKPFRVEDLEKAAKELTAPAEPKPKQAL